MNVLRTLCLSAAALVLVATTTEARIWPFFRAQPIDAPAESAETPANPDQPEAEPKKPRLIAPFVRGKININTCTLAQLQNLPGVGPSMGAHILAGRPYRNFEDLERDGVPVNVVSRLRDVVTFGSRP